MLTYFFASVIESNLGLQQPENAGTHFISYQFSLRNTTTTAFSDQQETETWYSYVYEWASSLRFYEYILYITVPLNFLQYILRKLSLQHAVFQFAFEVLWNSYLSICVRWCARWCVKCTRRRYLHLAAEGWANLKYAELRNRMQVIW